MIFDIIYMTLRDAASGDLLHPGLMGGTYSANMWPTAISVVV